MDEPLPAVEPAAADDDYEVVGVSVTWGGLSIAVFALTLLINLLGPRFFGLHFWWAAMSTVALSPLGLLLGLLGLKLGKNRGSARAGVFFNGVVVVIVFVVLPVAFLLWRRFG